jgi:hemerythrin-like metal-binding protein
MNWSGQLRIGIGDFDKEHREIVDALNALQTAVESGNQQSVTGPLLLKLAGDTVAHFKAEEEMMDSAKYPGMAIHRMKHQHLLEQLSAFLTRYTRNSARMDTHSLNFLRDWVTTHIQSEDMNFGLWLNEHGKR